MGKGPGGGAVARQSKAEQAAHAAPGAQAGAAAWQHLALRTHTHPRSFGADTLMDMLVAALLAVAVVVDYRDVYTNYAVMAILFTVAAYMNVLVRCLDDPFDGPPEYNFRCYAAGRELELSLLQCWQFGLMINFSCLTCDFGLVLRDILAEAEADDARRGAVAHNAGPSHSRAEERSS